MEKRGASKKAYQKRKSDDRDIRSSRWVWGRRILSFIRVYIPTPGGAEGEGEERVKRGSRKVK